jgi:Zn-dependent peptidase ImmA (M78 family)
MARIITALRDMVPIQPLSLIEALRIAELQSQRLLKLAGIEAPPTPERIITDLPHIQVERIDLGNLSGAAQWAHGRWLILINRKDVAGRQRFSICHEFKHVLDNPFADVLYSRCVPGQQRTEQICDYFAGCLLMPRPWLKTAWAAGTQDIGGLARQFNVSQLAMRVRLLQIGLIHNTARWERAA